MWSLYVGEYSCIYPMFIKDLIWPQEKEAILSLFHIKHAHLISVVAYNDFR